MTTEQFNLRIPGALARCVRIDAAERGVRPRDVIVELLESRFGPQTPEPIDGQLTVDETQGTDHSVGESLPPALASRRPRAARKAERSQDSPPESSETVNATATTPSGDGDGRRDREALVPVVDRSVAQEAPDDPGGAPESVEAGTPAGCPECAGELQDYEDSGTMYLRCEDCGAVYHHDLSRA